MSIVSVQGNSVVAMSAFAPNRDDLLAFEVSFQDDAHAPATSRVSRGLGSRARVRGNGWCFEVKSFAKPPNSGEFGESLASPLLANRSLGRCIATGAGPCLCGMMEMKAISF
jgi:hypothetical protein